MKTTTVKFFAGSGIRLAVLSVLFLGMAGVCMAQSSAAPARPAVQAAVASQGKSDAQAGQAATPEKPSAKGTQEGIKVHGHWTIEVKNPDGKLVTHREFENSLVPTQGAQTLAAILSGAITEGNWDINLDDSANAAVISLYQPQQSGNSFCQPSTTASCSYNLAISGPTFVSGQLQGSVLEFSGSGTVPSGYSAAVGAVQLNDIPCRPAVTYGACATVTVGSPNSLGQSAFTSRNLDGQNGDPAAVPVTAGQTVNVTVAISFQ